MMNSKVKHLHHHSHCKDSLKADIIIMEQNSSLHFIRVTIRLHFNLKWEFPAAIRDRQLSG